MDENPVIIARVVNPMDAELIAARLRSEGIRCFLLEENIARMHIFYSAWGGGIRIAVAASDASLARDILNQENVESNENTIHHTLTTDTIPRGTRIGILLLIIGTIAALILVRVFRYFFG